MKSRFTEPFAQEIAADDLPETLLKKEDLPDDLNCRASECLSLFLIPAEPIDMSGLTLGWKVCLFIRPTRVIGKTTAVWSVTPFKDGDDELKVTAEFARDFLTAMEDTYDR